MVARHLRRLLLAVCACCAFVLRAQADLPTALEGTWLLADESMLLDDSRNPAQLRITQVTPAPNDWSDGYFHFAWAGEPAASRGYYSLKTGRIWLTTRRYVDGRSQQVEYRGGLKGDAAVRWEGTAGTTGGTSHSWSFVATKD